MISPPFKCTCIPYFLQVLLKLSLKPWWYGTTMFGFGLLDCVGLELSVLLLVLWLDVLESSVLLCLMPMLDIYISVKEEQFIPKQEHWQMPSATYTG